MSTSESDTLPEAHSSKVLCFFSEPTEQAITGITESMKDNPHCIALMSAQHFLCIGKLVLYDQKQHDEINANRSTMTLEEFYNYLDGVIERADKKSLLTVCS
jgi:hypothetical protein